LAKFLTISPGGIEGETLHFVGKQTGEVNRSSHHDFAFSDGVLGSNLMTLYQE
jgi:hypothetical protein